MFQHIFSNIDWLWYHVCVAVWPGMYWYWLRNVYQMANRRASPRLWTLAYRHWFRLKKNQTKQLILFHLHTNHKLEDISFPGIIQIWSCRGSVTQPYISFPQYKPSRHAPPMDDWHMWLIRHIYS